MATLAPSEARRFAIAAPIPREPPVTSATLLANLDMGSPWFSVTIWHFSDSTDRDLVGPVRSLSDVSFLQLDVIFSRIPAISNGDAFGVKRSVSEDAVSAQRWNRSK